MVSTHIFSPRLFTSVLFLLMGSCYANPMPTGNEGTGTVNVDGTTSGGTGGSSTTPGFAVDIAWSSTLVGAGWSNGDVAVRTLVDFDGDQLVDLVALDANDFYISKNTGTNFAAPVSIRDDFTQAGGWASQTSSPRLFGDINGDGKADVVGFGANSVFTNFSTGTATSGEVAFETTAFTSSVGFTSQEVTPRFLADVDGDGRADLVGIDPNGIHVALSKTTGYAAPTLWSTKFTSALGWTSQTVTPRMMADVNGDDKADVVGFGPDGVSVALSKGSTFAAPQIISQEFVGSAWPNNSTTPRFAADINGDGFADLVAIDNSGVHIALGTGGASALPSYIAYVGFQPSAGWTSQMSTPRFVVDVNGDKKADLVGFSDAAIQVVLAP